MEISIEIDGIKELQRNLDSVRKGLGSKAAVMAVNRTATKARTEAHRVIREEYNIKQRDVTRKLRLLKAHKGRPYAVLEPRSEDAPLNVRRFTRGKRLNPRRKRQLTFQIRKADQGGISVTMGTRCCSAQV